MIRRRHLAVSAWVFLIFVCVRSIVDFLGTRFLGGLGLYRAPNQENQEDQADQEEQEEEEEWEEQEEQEDLEEEHKKEIVPT